MKQLQKFYSQISKHSNYQLIHPVILEKIDLKSSPLISRYDQERALFITQKLNLKNKKILDIGGNTGYFSCESIVNGAESVFLVEGNKEHAEFVNLIAELMDFPVTIQNSYYDFVKQKNNDFFDVVFLLNVLHHVGDDFGDKKINLEEAKNHISNAINSFIGKAEHLVLQLGFNWKGDRNYPIFQNGTKYEMIEFVYSLTCENWEISHIGIAEELNGKTIYNDLNSINIQRNEELGEFRNRPIFILKRKQILNSKMELNFLDSLVPTYKVDSPYSRIKKDIIISRIKSFVCKDVCKEVLQLGCSNGYETEKLIELFGKLDVVDGSLAFISKLKSETNNPKLKFIHSLFEEIASVVKDKKYDIIVCNYVLEHVSDPILILLELKKILKDVGIIFVVVPNSTALSRQIALNMNYLDNLTDLTENDLNHGHRRVYNKNSIEKDILLSGMEIVKSEGIIFKILADFQLNKLLNENMLSESHMNALQKLAMNEDNKQFSDSLFYVLKRSSNALK